MSSGKVKVNRTTWGGGDPRIRVGRACDIYLDANDLLDKKLGDLLFWLFYTEALTLKVDHTIWDEQWWNSGNTPTGIREAVAAQRPRPRRVQG